MFQGGRASSRSCAIALKSGNIVEVRTTGELPSTTLQPAAEVGHVGCPTNWADQTGRTGSHPVDSAGLDRSEYAAAGSLSADSRTQEARNRDQYAVVALPDRHTHGIEDIRGRCLICCCRASIAHDHSEGIFCGHRAL